jgi:hypothetical protein
MNHIPDAELALHVANDLQPDAHLAECAECRARMAEFRTANDWLQRIATQPSDEQIKTLRASVLASVSQRKPLAWRNLAAAAAAAVLVLFSGSRLIHNVKTPRPTQSPDIAELPLTNTVPVALGPLPKRPRPPARPRVLPPALVAGNSDPVVRLKTSDPHIVVLWVVNTNSKDENPNE